MVSVAVVQLCKGICALTVSLGMWITECLLTCPGVVLLLLFPIFFWLGGELLVWDDGSQCVLCATGA